MITNILKASWRKFSWKLKWHPDDGVARSNLTQSSCSKFSFSFRYWLWILHGAMHSSHQNISIAETTNTSGAARLTNTAECRFWQVWISHYILLSLFYSFIIGTLYIRNKWCPRKLAWSAPIFLEIWHRFNAYWIEAFSEVRNPFFQFREMTFNIDSGNQGCFWSISALPVGNDAETGNNFSVLTYLQEESANQAQIRSLMHCASNAGWCINTISFLHLCCQPSRMCMSQKYARFGWEGGSMVSTVNDCVVTTFRCQRLKWCNHRHISDLDAIANRVMDAGTENVSHDPQPLYCTELCLR